MPTIPRMLFHFMQAGAKTLVRLGQAVGPEAIHEIRDRFAGPPGLSASTKQPIGYPRKAFLFLREFPRRCNAILLKMRFAGPSRNIQVSACRTVGGR